MAVKGQLRMSFKDLVVPRKQSAAGILDVVFVHGLKNARTRTLKRRLKSWLSQLANRVSVTNRPAIRISIFGFDSLELARDCRSTLPVYSQALLEHLGKRSRQRNVVFIAHGAAGWVVKHAFSTYKSAQGYLSPGVMFLGLPQFETSEEWTRFLDCFVDSNFSEKPKLELSRFGPKSTKRLSGSSENYELDLSFFQSVREDFDTIHHNGYGPAVFTATIEDMDIVPPSAFQKTPLQRRRTDITIRPVKEFGSEDLAKMSFHDVSPESKTDKEVISFLQKQLIQEPSLKSTDHISSTLPETTSPRSSAPAKGSLASFPTMATGALSPLPEHPAQIYELLPEDGHRLDFNIPLFRKNGSLDLARDLSRGSERAQFIKRLPLPGSSHLSTSSEGKLGPKKLLRRAYEKEKRQLADDYYKSGELQKAKVLYQESLSITQGEFHDYTTQVQIETTVACRIAQICLLQGHYKQACTEFTELEKQARLKYPKGHRLVLEIQQWLGITLDMRGHYSKADDKLTEVEKVLIQATSGQYPYLTKGSVDFSNISIAIKTTLSMVVAHNGNFIRALSTNKEARDLAEEEEGRDARLGSIIFTRAAICAYHHCYEEAYTQNQEALEYIQQELGPNHVKTLDCLALRVSLLFVEGRMEEAEDLCRRTLRRMRREIGAKHPLTLRTLETQAKIYKAQGRLTDALDVAKHVRDENRDNPAIGPGHPQTLSSMSTLATIYAVRGQLNMALSQQQEVVRTATAKESSLGLGHVTTLEFQSELANIYALRREWTLSRSLAGEIFNQHCKKFVGDRYGEQCIQQLQVIDPVDYSDLLTVGERLRLKEIPTVDFHSQFSRPLLSILNRIGSLERKLGNLERSRRILEQVTNDRIKGFTHSHPDALESRFELAKTIQQIGELLNAEPEFAAVFKARSTVLGADHPDTLRAAHELSMTRFQMGYVEDSARELEIIFHTRFYLLGRNHPDTIKSQLCLADVNYTLGDFQGIECAKDHQLSALESQIQKSDLCELNQFAGPRKQLYEDAIDRCHIRHYAKSSESFIKDEKPRKYHKQNGSGIPQPPYYPDIISSMGNLASIYAYYRNYGDKETLKKAVQLQQAVCSLQKEYLGPTIQTFQSMNDLALMHQSLGDNDEAIRLFNEVTERCEALYFTSRSNLASLYFSQEDFEEAEKLQTEVLEKWLSCETGQHDTRRTVMYQFNLALTKSELGKKDQTKWHEATDLLTEALGRNATSGMEVGDVSRLLKTLKSRVTGGNRVTNGHR